MKILYISGSTQDKNVGVGSYGTEENRMQNLANLVTGYIKLGGGAICVHRNTGSMTLEQTVADSNAKKADYHLALHTNAGGGRGTECYYYWNTKADGKKWAQAIYDAVAPNTASSDRGCMPDNKLYSNGLYETRMTNAVAALIEIVFHDNLSDVNDYLAHVDQIALSIAKAIYKYFGMTYSPPVTPQSQPQSQPSTGKASKRYDEILKEVTPWASIYLADLKTMSKPGHNWTGLIEKLYYTLPK